MSFIVVYVTYPNMEEAKNVSLHLINKKLIACANLFPINSIYSWKGKIESSDEVVTLLKTRKKYWKKVKSEILKIHSYSVPCIIKYDVESNDLYDDWVLNETKSKARIGK